MARSGSHIDMSGPFFTRDPAKTFRQNARVMMRAMSLEGEKDVKQQLESGEGRRAPISRGTGARGGSAYTVTPSRVSAHVVAGVPHTATGGRWAQGGPIKVHVFVANRGQSKGGGIALMAAYAEVERQTHAFRRTTNRLRRSRKVNAAELLRGIA